LVITTDGVQDDFEGTESVLGRLVIKKGSTLNGLVLFISLLN
jgi:hypothetical protein